MDAVLFDEPHKLNGELSTLYIKSFYCGRELYQSAEQFISAYKAEYFGDDKTKREIMNSYVPQRARFLASKSMNCNEDAWTTQLEHAIYLANLYKFSENPFLLNTGDREIIACGTDEYWTCGCSRSELLSGKGKMKGQNKLGKILQDVREELKKKKPI